MNRMVWCVGAVMLVMGSGLASAQDVNVPLTGFELAAGSGIETEVSESAGADRADGQVRSATCVTFAKAGEERRLLAFEARADGSAVGAKAIAIRYRLRLDEGESLRLAALLFDAEGERWYKVNAHPVEVAGPEDGFVSGRISVGALREAAFSDDVGGELDWDSVAKVWIGLVIDGAAKGTFEISDARFTDEAYKPDKPLVITSAEDPGQWTIGKDPAVTATVATPDEGPDGKACMKVEFRLPGGRHMYCLPGTGIPGGDLEGYMDLQLTYKAELPEGIDGLLIWIGESGGAAYVVTPAPPPSDDWTTIIIPLDSLQLGGWTKDANQRFDLQEINRIVVGLHGTAAGEGGEGTIWCTDIQLTP